MTNSSSSNIQQALKKLEDELDVDTVKILTKELLEDAPQRLAKLRALTPSAQRSEIQHESHSLKSICYTYGMIDTGNKAQQLESAAANALATADLSTQLQSLADSFQADTDQLRQILEATDH